MEQFKQLNQEGTTIVLVTHEPEIANTRIERFSSVTGKLFLPDHVRGQDT